jgi:hypothetical protein
MFILTSLNISQKYKIIFAIVSLRHKFFKSLTQTAEKIT